MSNHFSGPDFGFPNGDARVDITDLFAFPKPGTPDRSVLIMDVNPLAPSQGNGFRPGAIYEIKVDTNGDAVADIAYRFTFSPIENGEQTATVRRVEGPDVAEIGDGGETLFRDTPVSFGQEAWVAEAGDYRFFAGIRSDPFFADIDGAIKAFQFTGSDMMVDKNVFSIALDVPNRDLGDGSRTGLWCRVLVPSAEATSTAGDSGARWVQVDRAAQPSHVNLFCQGEDKVEYNASEPSRDRELFLGRFAHALEHMARYSPDEARSVAETLLPDLLYYDHTRPARFPENGRTLSDDVFDYVLSRGTNGRVVDGVGPHTDLLADFPYLGMPHASSMEMPRAA